MKLSTLFGLFLIGLCIGFSAAYGNYGGYGNAATPRGTVHIVLVVQGRFIPPNLTVYPGDTVFWLWDHPGHSVEETVGPNTCREPARERFPDSPIADRGYHYQYVARQADVGKTIYYKCGPHCETGMRAKFNVVARRGGDDFPLTSPDCFYGGGNVTVYDGGNVGYDGSVYDGGNVQYNSNTGESSGAASLEAFWL
ncbi:Plastocyanin [Balamuthia mandrillaris]